MSRRTIRHGGVLACDMSEGGKKCPTTFTTYSMISLVRRQAEKVGWGRLMGRKVLDDEGHILAMGARKIDLCPEHATNIRWVPAKEKAKKEPKPKKPRKRGPRKPKAAAEAST